MASTYLSWDFWGCQSKDMTGIMEEFMLESRSRTSKNDVPVPVNALGLAEASHCGIIVGKIGSFLSAYWKATTFDMHSDKIWILDGGDRDGNPNVTAKVAKDVYLFYLGEWLLISIYVKLITSDSNFP